MSQHTLPAKLSLLVGIVAVLATASLAIAYVSPGGSAPGGQADTPLNTSGQSQTMDDLGIKVPPAGVNTFAVKNLSELEGFHSVGDVIVEGASRAGDLNNGTGLVSINGDLVVNGDTALIGEPGLVQDGSLDGGPLAPNLRPVCANLAGELVICGQDAGERRIHSCFYWSELSSRTTTLGPTAPGAPLDVQEWAANYNYSLSCHYQDTLGDPLDPANMDIEYLDFTDNQTWQAYSPNSARFGERLAIVPGFEDYRITTPVYWDTIAPGGVLLPASHSLFANANYGTVSGLSAADFDQFAITGQRGYVLSNINPMGNLENHVWRVRLSDGTTQGPWTYLHTNSVFQNDVDAFVRGPWGPQDSEMNIQTNPGASSTDITWTINTNRENMYQEYTATFGGNGLVVMLLRCDPDDVPAGIDASVFTCTTGSGPATRVNPTWGRVIDRAVFSGADISETTSATNVGTTANDVYFLGVIHDGPVISVGQTYGVQGGPNAANNFDMGYADSQTGQPNIYIITNEPNPFVFSFMNTFSLKKIASVLAICALVGFGIMQTVSGTGIWSNPASLGDERAPFVNAGPVKQIKEGSIVVGTGQGLANLLGSLVVHNPAEFIGGIFTSNNVTVNPSLPNPAAIIEGDLCVGYGTSCTSPAASPATFNLYGSTAVTNNIRIENLAHGESATYRGVCADSDGYLVQCDGTEESFDDSGPLLTQASGCFVAGTTVEMSDGSFKKIEDVKKGEIVRGSKQNNEVKIKYEIDYTGPLYSINGSKYFVSSSHPFMTSTGWKSFDPTLTAIESPGLEVGLLEKGDMLVLDDGSQQKLHKYDFVLAQQTVYNFGLEGSRDFYADGYLVHNVNLLPIANAAVNGASGVQGTTEVLTTKLAGTIENEINTTGPNDVQDVSCGLPDHLEGSAFSCEAVGLIIGMPIDPSQWGGDPWTTSGGVLGCYYPESTQNPNECGCDGINNNTPASSPDSPNQNVVDYGYCVNTLE